MKILVVEDEPKTGDYLKQGLSEAGFVVDLARDGRDGLHQALTDAYDLAVLDVMLPGIDGWQVLQGIRKAGKDIPVLFLTAKDSVEDRVKGLETGADDYLVKPFDLSELLARMRVLARRQAGAAVCILDSGGGLRLDLGTRVAAFQGSEARMSAREFALLQALMLRPGAILSRAELEDRIYGWNEEVESNAVEVLIHAVRKKLGASAIQNVRGMGWMVAKCA